MRPPPTPWLDPQPPRHHHHLGVTRNGARLTRCRLRAGVMSGPCCQIRVHAALVKILCRCVVRVLSGGFPVSQAS